LHVRLAAAEQGDAARGVIALVLGDGIMPGTGADPAAIAARLTTPAQAADVLAALTAANVEVAEFSVGTPSLDEVFLALTGKTSEEASEEQQP
jgi:ABC-2 type transport system ATP-binding protein